MRAVAFETLRGRPLLLDCYAHASGILCLPKNNSGVGPVTPTLVLSAKLHCGRYAILRTPYLARILVRRNRPGHGYRMSEPRNRLSAESGPRQLSTHAAGLEQARQSVLKAGQWRTLRQTDQGTLA